MLELNNVSPEILAKIKAIQSRQQTHPKYYWHPKPKTNCEVCESPNNLQRHHIRYNPIEVITVCYNCHCLIHNRDVGFSEGSFVSTSEKPLTILQVQRLKEKRKRNNKTYHLKHKGVKRNAN